MHVFSGHGYKDLDCRSPFRFYVRQSTFINEFLFAMPILHPVLDLNSFTEM